MRCENHAARGAVFTPQSVNCEARVVISRWNIAIRNWLTSPNEHSPNKRTSKYMKWKLTRMREETGKFKLNSEFSTVLSIIHKTSRQKNQWK